MTAKEALYKRVSPIIGAFDCGNMTCDDVAAYSAKKLQLNVAPKNARVALDSFLAGVERTKKVTQNPMRTGDSAGHGGFTVIDDYLKGN